MTRVYLDTGIFMDYLSPVAFGGASLRTAPRRGRSPQTLNSHAAALLRKVEQSHVGATSCLTYYEAEEALHRVWTMLTRGVAFANQTRVLAARTIMPQVAMAIRFFNLQELSLTPTIIAQLLNQPVLQVNAVRAADAMHVCSALEFGADVIVSADDDILKLDGQLQNAHGVPLRCLDTDHALAAL
jgi:hypothetical protein